MKLPPDNVARVADNSIIQAANCLTQIQNMYKTWSKKSELINRKKNIYLCIYD